MRRLLVGLLTLGAYAAHSAALAKELAGIDDFATSPLRTTLEPDAETVDPGVDDWRVDPGANAREAAVIIAGLEDSALFDRIGLRGGSTDSRAARPIADLANGDFLGPPFWASEADNIAGIAPDRNIFFEYQAIAEAIKFQGLFGLGSPQAHVWRQDQQNRRPGAGLGTLWSLECAPSPETMLFVKGFYSDVFHRSLVEIKPGYAVLDNFSFAAFPPGKLYIGPFAVLTGRWRDKISQAGLQLTFGDIGAFSLTLAGGVSRDTYTGAGVFGLIEASLRF